ncbi:MAG TPA: CHASE3 domain-containing protein [Steroidobacteraceae bacterium]|nr:CHASE3 domain-containing protein [Steroidobacteraceae bacterium]
MTSAARQLVVVALLLFAVIGLFVAAESGQSKLAAASRRVEKAAQREHAIGDVMQAVTQAESGQRGYILTGETSYLRPYQDGMERLPAELAHLTDSFAEASPQVRGHVAEIASLCRAKFEEMTQTLDLYRDRGRSAAVELIRTDYGQRTMAQITDLVGKVQAAETDDMLNASHSWRSDRWFNLVMRVAALLASLFLGILLLRLGLRYIYSKEREVEESVERQNQLERMVKRRTEDLSELSTQLQTVAEKERAALARELHDELGGLLVAARMDLSWLEEKVGSEDPVVQSQFKRVHEALQAGVDLKRRVVENLRPTLLDNLGLFPALRWQVSDSCGRAGLNCTESYPDEELDLSPEASIAIFRIVQESLTNILKHAQARNVDVAMEVRDDWLVISVRDDGVGMPIDRRRALRSHGLASMRHRVIAFGGQWRIIRRTERGTEIEAKLPLQNLRAAGRPAQDEAGEEPSGSLAG